MFRTPFVAALALLAAAPTLPHAPEPTAAALRQAYPAIVQVGWSYGDPSFRGGPPDQLRFFVRERLNSSAGAADAADVKSVIGMIGHARPGDPIAFTLAREAGTLVCTGRAEASGRAAGSCRFDPSDGFAAALARRAIAPKESDEMLGLALVDARLAVVDGLAAEGFRFGDAGELIAVSALGVTPGYASELRDAGLHVDQLGDLIAARALKIDAAWLGAMARAGYPDLAVGQAIQMRALGVTPDYAIRMGRVLHAVHEIE